MQCSYCQEDRPLTREHVIPAFVYDFQNSLGEGFTGWNEPAKRMVGGEGTIKDVCQDCNNGFLSDLDTYGKSLLAESGLLVQNYTRQSLSLRYDRALLLRWLLKISFNSSRRDGAHRHLFEPYVPFIRGLAPMPARWQVVPLLYMANAEVAGRTDISAETFTDIAQGAKRLNPFIVRICYGSIPGSHNYTPRMVIFGPAVFLLLMFDDHVRPGHASAAVRHLTKVMPGIVELTDKRKVADVSAGQRTWLDLYEHQVLRTQAYQARTRLG